jgi:hypothetical protein
MTIRVVLVSGSARIYGYHNEFRHLTALDQPVEALFGLPGAESRVVKNVLSVEHIQNRISSGEVLAVTTR